MVTAANNEGGVVASYHTHLAKAGADYYTNSSSDIVSKVNATSLSTASNGPSPGDFNDIATYFSGDQILIDRSHFYFYNNSTVVNNNLFLFRYFPLYWLWVNE